MQQEHLAGQIIKTLVSVYINIPCQQAAARHSVVFVAALDAIQTTAQVVLGM